MSSTWIVTGVVAVAAVAAGAVGWSAMEARIAELEGRLGALDETAAARAGVVRERLAAADGALSDGADRDRALSQRLTDVEAGSERFDDAQQRTGALEDRLLDAVRALQRADDDNVQLVRTYEQRLEKLERSVGALYDAWEELPLGTVLAWLPAAGEPLPEGWAVCDGSNGTPDLRGLFLRGVATAGEAGRYFPASRMTAAGLHAHDDGSANHNRHGANWGSSRDVGDARMLFDTDVLSPDPQKRAQHGEHVHEDPNVPEHATVVYILRVGR